MRISLNGDDWKLTGWNRHQWKYYTTMETGGPSRPVVPTVPARVPGAVQTDLFRAGRIEDWRVGTSFFHNEWVERREWVYEKTFRLPENAKGKRCFVCFEGLDFSGHVFFNNREVLSFNGMHLPYEAEITDLLKEGENRLRIVFLQPPEVDGQVGYTSNTTILKSRYNYGWDWMPRLVNIGIFGNVYLRLTESAYFTEMDPVARADGEDGAIALSAKVRCLRDGQVFLKYAVCGESGIVASGTKPLSLTAGEELSVEEDIHIANVRRWNVIGQGGQPLYSLRVWIEDGGIGSADSWSGRVGFRELTYHHPEGAPERSLPYAVSVNGQWVPIKGLNWVPISPFYGSVTEEEYRYYIDRLCAMHINLLRVWGGALLESETFYRICDEKGILVWQEFPQSSSGIDNAPCEDPTYIQELTEVAACYIRRRRYHASLAFWCAGNELYDAEYHPMTNDNPNVGALAAVTARMDPERLYLPDSPSGDVAGWRPGLAADVVCGDTHGPWKYVDAAEHCYLFNNDPSLLHSEVGAPAPPREETLRRYADGPIWPFDESNPYWLNRGAWWIYYNEMVRFFGPFAEDDAGFSDYVRAYRYTQMEAVRYAVTAIRRAGRKKAGVIVWMANEPFPNSANTSVIEYDGCPRPVFYKLANAFAPASLALAYDSPAVKSGENAKATLFAFADAKATLKNVRTEIFDRYGNRLFEQSWGDVTVEHTAELGAIPLPTVAPLIVVRLTAEGEHPVREEYVFTVDGENTFGALLYDACEGVRVQRLAANRFRLTNPGKTAALFVECIGKDHNEVPLTVYNNYACLLPGESIEMYTDVPCEKIEAITLNHAQEIQVNWDQESCAQ